MAVGSTAGNGVTAYENCYQTWDDVSSSFYGNWNSANTGIVTVDYYGTHTGVSVGSTTSNTAGSLDGIQPRLCPIRRYNPAGGANVQKPAYVQVVGSSNDTTVCLGSGCETDLVYRVLDTNRAPINRAGMTIAESVSINNNNTTCSGNFADSGTWTTDSSGTMNSSDTIYWCCSGQANNNCRLSFDQYFTVNGQSVLIMGADGKTVGIKNTVTINCTNGQASCPGILIN